MDSAFTAVGNLARDPELRFTQGGQAVVSFGLAVNRRWQKNGQWEEEVSFIDVTAWGTLAENVSECLNKGDRALVCGRIQQQSWESKEGEKRNKIVVQADSIGPDLRWATATVVKNDRREGGGNQQSSDTGSQAPSEPYGEDPGF